MTKIARTLGVPHHLVIAVKSQAESKPFYTDLLSQLGYTSAESWNSDTSFGFMHDETGFEIGFSNAVGDSPAHAMRNIGYHHLAFAADSKEKVDKIYKSLVEYYAANESSGMILDTPRFYPNYGKHYYAVFFTDPNNLKLEIANQVE